MNREGDDSIKRTSCDSRFMPDWEAAAEVKQDVCQPLKPGMPVETKVGGLKYRAEYQFRVIAVNKAGNSPESEPTDHHLVKHKACKLSYLFTAKITFSSHKLLIL